MNRDRAVILAAFLLLLAPSLAAEEVRAQVVQVVDGDTIQASVSGNAVKVRLLWIDTPEKRDNAHGAAMTEGGSATAALAELLPAGAEVRLWSPRDRMERDRYGRLLALVLLKDDDTTAQEAVIRAGWSVYWRKYGEAPTPYHDRLLKAQDEARLALAGAWKTAPRWMTDKSNERTARQPRFPR